MIWQILWTQRERSFFDKCTGKMRTKFASINLKKLGKMIGYTCKSLSEALIFASIIPQYDNRLFMELLWKLQAQNMGRTCSGHVLPMVCACSSHGNSMNNLLSHCGSVDARISASEKDLPVPNRAHFFIQRSWIWTTTISRLTLPLR